ncbi:MAG: ACT domain-containing protein [Thermoplasmata archaeon]|nr:ACT domain-containing protein [Thermoplasmata archaeon]
MNRSKPAGPSVADVTRAYIEEHPSIREALSEELLNYTALARKIQAERGVRNEEAVTIACRRYERGLRTETPELRAIRSILHRSRLQVHSRVAIVRFQDDWEILDRLLQIGRATLPDRTHRQMFQLFQGTVALTLLCEEDYLGTVLPEIPARLRLAVERGLATLAFRSHPQVADTPGVLAHMADALFRRGINCLETVSVHTDSIFVFRDADVIPAYQVLSDLFPASAADADVAAKVA